jgi:hypothetical protein
MDDHMYIKVEIVAIDSSVCRNKFIKAKLSDSVGNVISDVLEDSDCHSASSALQVSKVSSEGTDIDLSTPIKVLKDFG